MASSKSKPSRIHIHKSKLNPVFHKRETVEDCAELTKAMVKQAKKSGTLSLANKGLSTGKLNQKLRSKLINDYESDCESNHPINKSNFLHTLQLIFYSIDFPNQFQWLDSVGNKWRKLTLTAGNPSTFGSFTVLLSVVCSWLWVILLYCSIFQYLKRFGTY